MRQTHLLYFNDRHASILMGIAVRVLVNPVEAEDVLQEVALLLWERASHHDSSLGKPLSWVVALTRKKAIDRLRSLSWRPTVYREAIGEWGGRSHHGARRSCARVSRVG
ncbi:MAG: hypothetical protein EXS36_12845 [Pedosphaera sp.]|nr:hypothetical protein [Pedosphaera sp.]